MANARLSIPWLTQIQLTWIAVLALAVLVRLLFLGSYPLADTTEARYAEVARLMLVSGDWITPQIEAGVPFWGKPPLSFWLTAGSFKIFGISEFAARLPALLQLIATALLLLGFTGERPNRNVGVASAGVFLSSGLAFISAGAVMTDPSLVFSTTLAMVGFWRAVKYQSQTWGYLFFLGLGLGLLAKGPVAWVISLAPIVLWALWFGRVRETLNSLPWGFGIPLAAIVSVPWYLMAESHSPGFLQYFIVGEHWLRFVDSGWTGDLYGNAHDEPRGKIWLFWVVSALPWSFFAAYALVRHWRENGFVLRVDEDQAYLVLWATIPMVFFSFASNILYTYVLPGLPALALLIGLFIDSHKTRAIYVAAFVPLLFLVAGPVFLFDAINDKSERDLVRMSDETEECARLVYLQHRPYSAEFYSSGKAELAADASAVRHRIEGDQSICVAIRNSALKGLPDNLNAELIGIRQFAKYTLFRTS
jgi:4-amino-4-deoxy-L-arabinose transferase-like glycosyltransferase